MAFFRCVMVRIRVSTSCFHAELCTQKKAQGDRVGGVSDGLKKVSVYFVPYYFTYQWESTNREYHPRGKLSISLHLTAILKGTDEI